MLPTTIAAPPVAERSAASSSSTAARLSLAAAGLFVLLLAVLHLVRRDLDPSWTVISAYALGEQGWMMTAAFASLGVACASLVAAVWPQTTTKADRLGLVLLSVSAIGFALAALFPSDPITASADEATTRGQLHNLGAMLGGNIPVAALLLAWRLPRDPVWRSARRSLWLAAAVAWLGQIVFVASLATMLPADGRLGPDVLIGWPNRLMIVAYCACLMIVASRAASRSGGRTA